MKATIIKILLGLVGVAIVAAISVYFAMSDKGAIDVSQQIKSTNQEGFTSQVQPDSRAEMPNGGLNPQGGQQTPQPPAPEPTPAPATTTDASTTSTTASDTPAQ